MQQAGAMIDVAAAVTALDVPVLMALLGFAVWKGWLRLGREVTKLEDDVVLWQRIALESLAVGESAIEGDQ